MASFKSTKTAVVVTATFSEAEALAVLAAIDLVYAQINPDDGSKAEQLLSKVIDGLSDVLDEALGANKQPVFEFKDGVFKDDDGKYNFNIEQTDDGDDSDEGEDE